MLCGLPYSHLTLADLTRNQRPPLLRFSLLDGSLPLSFVSLAGETPLFGFLALWHHLKQPIQSGEFQVSDSSASRSHTVFANFSASSAAPFPGLFHPGSTYGLFSTGVSPPTTVRVLSHALSPHAVAAKVATLSASARPRLQRDSQSGPLQGLVRCPSPFSWPARFSRRSGRSPPEFIFPRVLPPVQHREPLRALTSHAVQSVNS